MLLIFFCAGAYGAPRQSQPRTKEEQLIIYMDTGKKLLDQKKYDDALKYFAYVAKQEPKNKDALKQIAFVYYAKGNHNYAYTMFKKVLELDPQDKDALEFMDFYNTVIEAKNKVKQKREPLDSVWRAAAIPGWGQVHNNQHVKGIVVGGAFLLSAGLCVYNVADEITKYDKYIATNQNHDIAYTKAQEAWWAALISGAAAGLVYVYGIVDAGLNYNCEEARMGVVAMDGGGVALAWVKEW